ncbi:hypothetical protein QFZ28_002253 [Neobacillus niacini]|uniref:hypothetical protein n=1 Tax=Neobacillus niacini TaxID=86668 RepID=UPI002783E331|nr:hypothetical protein [Neobacillus niacini]MDQ1001853.1 hypothetical protein [Neobacillus niacini]
MFDPTAFDNMKVVIEGALYDLDLAGEIIITDRNDIVNMAKMSRIFDIHFQQSSTQQPIVTAKLEIKAELINLAAELLPNSMSQKQAGCIIKLQFYHHGLTDEAQFKKIQEIFIDIWGETRQISQSVTLTPSKSLIHNCISIEFDRLISEDQMDDLVEMINFMMTSIVQLQSYLREIS